MTRPARFATESYASNNAGQNKSWFISPSIGLGAALGGQIGGTGGFLHSEDNLSLNIDVGNLLQGNFSQALKNSSISIGSGASIFNGQGYAATLGVQSGLGVSYSQPASTGFATTITNHFEGEIPETLLISGGGSLDLDPTGANVGKGGIPGVKAEESLGPAFYGASGLQANKTATLSGATIINGYNAVINAYANLLGSIYK